MPYIQKVSINCKGQMPERKTKRGMNRSFQIEEISVANKTLNLIISWENAN